MKISETAKAIFLSYASQDARLNESATRCGLLGMKWDERTCHANERTVSMSVSVEELSADTASGGEASSSGAQPV